MRLRPAPERRIAAWAGRGHGRELGAGHEDVLGKSGRPVNKALDGCLMEMENFMGIEQVGQTLRVEVDRSEHARVGDEGLETEDGRVRHEIRLEDILQDGVEVQGEPVRRELRLHGDRRLGADRGRDHSPERTLAPQPIAIACTRLTLRAGRP